jgi:putative ABC transport system permease protein
MNGQERSRGGVGLWRLTWFNLLRKPGRSFAAVLGVMLTAGTLFAGSVISAGAHHAVQTGLGRLGADLMVVPKGAVAATHTALVVGEPVAFYMDGAVAAKVAAVPGVAAVSHQVYVETLASAACCTGRLFLVGYDPATDFTVKPWLDAQLGRPLAGNEIIVGNHVLMLEGASMKFFGSEFKVAGRLESTGMGMDETVFLPAPAVATMAANSVKLAEKPLEIPPGSVSAVMVKLVRPGEADEVARRIEEAVPGVAAMTGGQIARGVTRDLAGLMSWLMPIAGGVLLISLLLLLLLFSAITAERSREIGLLRAMGATARQAVSSLVGEALLLGGIGGGVGVLAGMAVYYLFQRRILFSYVLPFLWPSTAVEITLAVAVIVGSAGLAALAALGPALRIAKLDPHFAIHGGNPS